MNEFTMNSRYFMMIVAGMLAQRGYVNEDLTEPMIGLGVMFIAYVWKKIEDYKKKAKKVK